jgi:hypothetical protein
MTIVLERFCDEVLMKRTVSDESFETSKENVRWLFGNLVKRCLAYKKFCKIILRSLRVFLLKPKYRRNPANGMQRAKRMPVSTVGWCTA